MFWKFQPPIPQIDSILDKEDITLAEILDEDGVVQECKTINRKLINFLMQSENVDVLIKLVINEPSPSLPDSIKYKHANIACEILNGDVEDIVDVVFGMTALLPEDSNKYLDMLCSFIDQSCPLNPLLASFFMKVVSGLALRRGKRMVAYLRNRPNFLSQLLYHLGTPAIMDLLLKLIQQADPSSKSDVAEWFATDHLVDRLVEGMHPDKDDTCHSNCSHLLCELLTTCREQVAQFPDNIMENSSDSVTHPPFVQLLDALECPRILDELLTYMLTLEPKKSVVINCLSYFQAVLDKRPCENSLDLNHLFFSTPSNPIRLLQATSTLANVLEPKLPELKALLHSPPKQEYSVMETTVGILLPPLGRSRLLIVQLLNYLFALNYANLNKALYQVNVLDTILDLFKQYPWNSFLHHQVECIVTSILTRVPAIIPPDSQEADENEENYCLIKQLLVQCQIIRKLLSWFSDNQRIQECNGKRRGYMGHIITMANLVRDNIISGPNMEIINCYFSELDEEVKENWKQFLIHEMKELNDRNHLEPVMSGWNYYSMNGEDYKHLTNSTAPSTSYGFTEESNPDTLSSAPDGDYFQPVPVKHNSNSNDVFQSPSKSCMNNVDYQSLVASSSFSNDSDCQFPADHSHLLNENHGGSDFVDPEDEWLDREIALTMPQDAPRYGDSTLIAKSRTSPCLTESDNHSTESSLGNLTWQLPANSIFERANTAPDQLISDSYCLNPSQSSDLSFNQQSPLSIGESPADKYRLPNQSTEILANDYSLPHQFLSSNCEEAMEVSSTTLPFSTSSFVSSDLSRSRADNPPLQPGHQYSAISNISGTAILPDSSQWAGPIQHDSINLSLPYTAHLSRLYDDSSTRTFSPADCQGNSSQLNEAMDTSDSPGTSTDYYSPSGTTSLPRSTSLPTECLSFLHSSSSSSASSVKSFLSSNPIFNTASSTTDTTTTASNVTTDQAEVVSHDLDAGDVQMPRTENYSYPLIAADSSMPAEDTDNNRLNH